MLRVGFEDLGLHRICGRLDGRNAASARVLERLGMRREAQLLENERVKGEWANEVVYAMLDREWRRRSGRDGGQPRAGRLAERLEPQRVDPVALLAQHAPSPSTVPSASGGRGAGPRR